MALLTVSVNNPGFDKRSTIIGTSATGVANTALGSWTYTSSASKP